MTYGVALRFAQLFWAGFGLVNYAVLASRGADPAPHIPAALHRAD